MNNMVFSKIKEAMKNVSDIRYCFLLCKFGFLPENLIEVALTAELCNNIAVSVTGEDFETAKNIWMLQLFQDIDFREEEFL